MFLFNNKPERTCQICINNDLVNNNNNNNTHVNEVRVLFNCNRYAQLRNVWIEKLTLPIDYLLLNSYEKLDVVLNHAENVKLTSQFLINMMDLRSKILFNLEK